MDGQSFWWPSTLNSDSKEKEMKNHRITLLNGVVFAKETGGLLGGAAAQQKEDAEAKEAGIKEATGLTPEQALITNEGVLNAVTSTGTLTGAGNAPEPVTTGIDPSEAFPESIEPVKSVDDKRPFADGSNRMEKPLSFNVGLENPDAASDLEFTDDGFIKPIAAYKHRSVMRFRVGKFTFQNHILLIYNEADNQEFLDLAADLTPQDKTQIVHYNWEAAANVEKPVDYAAVSRGAVNTRATKDPKVIQ